MLCFFITIINYFLIYLQLFLNIKIFNCTLYNQRCGVNLLKYENMKKNYCSNLNKIKLKEVKQPFNVKIKPTYSIQNILYAKKKNKEEVLFCQNKVNSVVRLSDITNCYLKFINTLLIRNEIRLPIFNSIKNIKFININLDFLVDIEVSSNVVLCNFQLIEKEFLKDLCITISNNYIKFNIIIKKHDCKIFFSREDILNKMIIKNELVLKLKNELGLVF